MTGYVETIGKIATVLDDPAPELARNYAEAIVNAADGEGSTEAAISDLEEIVADIVHGQPQFMALFDSPSLGTDEKDRILAQTFEGRTLPIVVQFLRVLNRHGRLSLITSIVRRARETWDKRQNRRSVTVRSAVALDEHQVNALRDRLASFLQATPVLTLETDPTLIGGLVVQVGDDLYDASVKSRLEQIRNRLIEGKRHEIQSRRDHFGYSA